MYHLTTHLIAIGPVLVLLLVVRVLFGIIRACHSARSRAAPPPGPSYDLTDYWIDTQVCKLPKSYALTRLFVG